MNYCDSESQSLKSTTAFMKRDPRLSMSNRCLSIGHRSYKIEIAKSRGHRNFSRKIFPRTWPRLDRAARLIRLIISYLCDMNRTILIGLLCVMLSSTASLAQKGVHVSDSD